MNPVVCLSLLLFAGYVLTRCPPSDYYPIPSFGENCRYRCHCAADVQCNNVTGDCPGSCARGWMGPACQYRNVALNYSGLKQTGSNDDPAVVNDGDLLTCINLGPSNGSNEHYWRVELIRPFYIVGLIIHTMTGGHSTSVRIETADAMDFTTGLQQCAQSLTVDGGGSKEIMCRQPVLARAIQLANQGNKATLSLCELEIYGGRHVSFNKNTTQESTLQWGGKTWHSRLAVDGTGTWNDTYSLTCSATKDVKGVNRWWQLNLRTSYRIEDVYVFSRPGFPGQTNNFKLRIGGNNTYQDTNQQSHYVPWTLDLEQPVDGETVRINRSQIMVLCEVIVYAECLPGRCGWECSDVCMCTTLTTGSMRLGAVCPDGCQGRWTGTNGRCDRECLPTQWGSSCNRSCGHCANNETCDLTNGTCPRGCIPSWKPGLCNEKCDDGLWGFGCKQTCGTCSFGGACDKVDGTCYGGCRAGFNPPLCVEECDTGSFGRNCSETCGACLNKTCSPVDGNCLVGCIEGYSGALCRQKIDPPSSWALIVCTLTGVTGVLLAVFIAVCVVLGYRKRRRQKESTSDTVEFAVSPLCQTACQPDFDESREYVNFKADQIQPEGDRRAIAVSDLRQFVRNISHVQEELVADYRDLPNLFDLPRLAGRKEKNIPKNKYQDILPYDFNRLELQGLAGQDDSDYINASLIQSSVGGRSYIASQGPIQKTLPDFWRMVREESVAVIVMLTNCVELGKVKCVQYWPERDRGAFGDLEVTLLSETAYKEYTVRCLLCKKVGVEISQEVMQFHFTTWPDKQVPETALSLVNFWRQVRKCDTAGPVRWLVHCSAGVGRTGVFIALDALYETGRRNNIVNVFEYVAELRRQRQSMVQTAAQYVFLHMALTEALVPIGTVCSEEVFNEHLTGLTDSTLGQASQLQIEYEALKSMTGEESPDTEYANITYKSDLEKCGQSFLKENREKSRNENILPPDEYRPRLGCDVDNRNDYINAVNIPTYRLGGGLILTQVPLSHTVVDFLRLVMTYNVKFVVLLESNVPQNCQYWPQPGDSESKIFGPLTVTQVGETVDHFHTSRVLKCSYKDQSMDVTLLHYTGSWMSDIMCPGDHGSFQKFVSDVYSIIDPSVSPEPIVVQCLDGNEKSCLFAAFYMIIERIRCIGDVSIAETVLRVRDRRRQAICSVEQYQLLHTATRNYIDSLRVYVNMST